MGVWDFIQDQVLGMQWLNALIGMGLSALGLDVTGRIGGSIQFFIYDVLKITVLLCVLIFAISSKVTSRRSGVNVSWGDFTEFGRTLSPLCWERLRLFAPAHLSRCSSALRVRACRWV